MLLKSPLNNVQSINIRMSGCEEFHSTMFSDVRIITLREKILQSDQLYRKMGIKDLFPQFVEVVETFGAFS